jgi:hypothetical protein
MQRAINFPVLGSPSASTSLDRLSLSLGHRHHQRFTFALGHLARPTTLETRVAAATRFAPSPTIISYVLLLAVSFLLAPRVTQSKHHQNRNAE